ncbi:MAG: glycerophosphodiester phosphodiesterase [Sulfolobales archaeon]
MRISAALIARDAQHHRGWGLGSKILEILSRKPFAVIGHRGASGLAPENTLASFSKAIEVGSDMVELDVQLTSDGVAIALHDEDLKRVAGLDINVRRKTYAEISSIRIRGEPIPRLEDVLRLCVERVGVLIEIKVSGDEGYVIDTIKSLGAVDWVAIISFSEEPLRRVKKAMPSIPVGIIYTQPPGKIVDAKREGFEMALPRYPLATQRSIELAHRLGIKVIAWTVNDEKWVRELASRGVDGITTDYPDMAVRVRENLSKSNS